MASNLDDYLLDNVEEQRLHSILRELILSDMIYTDKTKPQYFVDDTSLNELTDFLEKDFGIKDWLRVRIFEAVGTSKGLDDYLRHLINNRHSDPSVNTNLNYLFSISYLSRALDRYVSLLLKRLKKDKKIGQIDSKKIDYLVSFYENNINFRIKDEDVKFTSDEIELLRRKILELSLNIFYNDRQKSIDSSINKNELKILHENVNMNLNKILSINKNNDKIDIKIIGGYIKYVYMNYPPIYLDNNKIYCNRDDYKYEVNVKQIKDQINYLLKSGLVKL